MRLALQTWGTDGDIRPFVALGAGLVRRGHSVVLAIASLDDTDYGDMCRAVGIEVVRLPGGSPIDLERLRADVERQRLRTPVTSFRFLCTRMLFPAWPAMGEAAARICTGADVAVGHFLAAPLRLAAEQRRLPYASVAFWPGLVPEPCRAPEGLPSAGPLGNRLLWRGVLRVLDRIMRADYRRLFRESGREMPADIVDAWYSRQLNLLACSPSLWPDVSRRPPHAICGYWSMPADVESATLSPDVEAFVDAAPSPPVFLTLGSSGQVDPTRSKELLVEVAERTGLPAIVQLDPRSSPPPDSASILYVRRTRHAALLPRCSAALHHGGAGTSHAALAAGCPAVTVTFMADQHSWGRRLVRSGVGAAVFRYRSASPAKIARALRRAALDRALRARAVALGQALEREDGVLHAIHRIEQLAMGHR
jgi:sterol 3beta-glucosyltransferase/vancomycin aglycone glucosyltransferase